MCPYLMDVKEALMNSPSTADGETPSRLTSFCQVWSSSLALVSVLIHDMMAGISPPLSPAAGQGCLPAHLPMQHQWCWIIPFDPRGL
jgi:hypothetical protein